MASHELAQIITKLTLELFLPDIFQNSFSQRSKYFIREAEAGAFLGETRDLPNLGWVDVRRHKMDLSIFIVEDLEIKESRLKNVTDVQNDLSFSAIYTRGPIINTQNSTELPLLKEKAEFSRLVGKEKSPCKMIWGNQISMKTICFNNWYYIVKKMVGIDLGVPLHCTSSELVLRVNYDVNDGSHSQRPSQHESHLSFSYIQHKSQILLDKVNVIQN